MSTRQKIIDTAIGLFNTKGYDAVTLAEIAEVLGISRGNLAYHYKDKEQVLKVISGQIQDEIDQSMKLRKDFPAFSNLQVDIKSYHRLQQKYQFVFSNQSVLKLKTIREVMQGWSQRTIQNNLDAFAYAIEIGNMEPEPLPGLYHNLAINTWMIVYFWLSQKTVRNVSDLQDAEKMVWSTIIPYFTPKGLSAFEKYFGPDSSQKLGRPLNAGQET